VVGFCGDGNNCGNRKGKLLDTGLGNVGMYCSAYLEGISYYDAINGDLKCAYKNEAQWQIERVGTMT